MTIETGKKLYPQRIEANVSYDIYEVTGVVYQYSDDALIDACDRNNWGGVVLQRTEYYAKIKIYTD